MLRLFLASSFKSPTKFLLLKKDFGAGGVVAPLSYISLSSQGSPSIACLDQYCLNLSRNARKLFQNLGPFNHEFICFSLNQKHI